jgi:N-acetylmuramoyl-L-alanine amidase
MKPVIVIDPGHGDSPAPQYRGRGYDPGVVDPVAEPDRHEAVAALEISLTFKELLEGDGWDVILTRDGTGPRKPDLYWRTRMAVEKNALAFVSVHYNSVGAPGLVYYPTGNWVSLNFAKRLAREVSVRQTTPSSESRFGGLYIDYFPYASRERWGRQRPAVMLEVSSIRAAPPAGATGRSARITVAEGVVRACRVLKP